MAGIRPPATPRRGPVPRDHAGDRVGVRGAGGKLTTVRHVGHGIWLATALPPAPRRLAGLRRREADCRAASVARAAALRMIEHAPDRPCVSVSHSAGAGAAIVAPPPWKVGVDVMPLGRVDTRHVEAILSGDELDLLRAIEATLAPTVAWTVKEAAAKASGRADKVSLKDLRIRTCTVDGEARIDGPGDPSGRLIGRWATARGFVYAWVVGR